jgi:transcriptional antiterminator NusG
MDYYTIQVKTGDEEGFVKRFGVLYPECGLHIYFPKRKLDIRKQGKTVRTERGIFPGYLFVETEDMPKYYHLLRQTGGFFRFLPSNQNIKALKDKDLEIVLHFIRNVGGTADVSTAYFNENAQIVITHGPLMGLEGYIVKVDRRKKRARVKLNLYQNSFAIDFAFEEIGKK